MGKIILLLLLTLLSFQSAVHADSAPTDGQRAQPVAANHGMVATSHHLATRAALTVLQSGGNAIDGAVTAAFALAVAQPRSGNIGGGGFMLISREKTGEVIAIDYREKAPAGAGPDMFIDGDGTVDNNLARHSHLAAGVPGTVAGLALALERYGTISLEEALAPAIKLAEEGFVVTTRFSDGLKSNEKRLKKWPATRKIFFKPTGNYYEQGERFLQPDLASTLRRISRHGAREFYTGRTARLLVAEMERHNGLITMADLAAYQPVLRQPVQGTYRGYTVYSMPPPSSGGIHLIQMLNILEGFPLASLGHNSARTIHVMAETMKLAYSDRSRYLGDEDFVEVPRRGLVSKAYAHELRKQINPEKATPSRAVSPGNPLPYESGETTHFSIADRYGNCVSNTYTINFSYGSGIVVEGAGFFLNNEMDDFAAKPGVANAYGLIGGRANRIAPGKRMLSSMTPTIVKKEGKNFLVTGSPGGSRIITTTLQVIINVIDHGLNIQSSVNAPRIHHQWLPDQLRIEEGISPDTRRILADMGHTVVQKRAMGASQSILLEQGIMHGAGDPRRATSLAAGL